MTSKSLPGKTCTGCKKRLPKDFFSKRAASKDGLQYRCNDCMRQGTPFQRTTHEHVLKLYAHGNHIYVRELANAGILTLGNYSDKQFLAFFKVCGDCGREYPVTRFTKDTTQDDGYSTCCNICSGAIRVPDSYGIHPRPDRKDTPMEKS